MVEESNHPNSAADRLENALERIARLAAAKSTLRVTNTIKPDRQESLVQEAAKQLDALIDRLRTNIFEQGF